MVTELGKSIKFADGLMVSVGQAQRYTTSASAAPEQFRGKSVLMLTVTVTNNSADPVSIDPGLAGPQVSYAGQQVDRVFDPGVTSPGENIVLPGKSFIYSFLFATGSGPADIQAQWTRTIGGSPAIFTGQG